MTSFRLLDITPVGAYCNAVKAAGASQARRPKAEVPPRRVRISAAAKALKARAASLLRAAKALRARAA
ncbi:MAG: hypothetical protein AAF495_27820 [Pseudomonadota bacterium]